MPKLRPDTPVLPADPADFVYLPEAQEITGHSRNWLRLRADAGRIRRFRYGDRNLYLRSELIALMESEGAA